MGGGTCTLSEGCGGECAHVCVCVFNDHTWVCVGVHIRMYIRM